MKVLNFGSLNIDYVYSLDHFVKKGETISSNELNVYSGGKGLNQSIALGKAGVEVYHAGKIGTDGEFLVEMLQASNVHTDYVQMYTKVRTGNAIIQNDSQGDNCIILFGGANQTITKEQIVKTIDEFEAGDYLILQNEINEIPYIVEKAKEKGMIIVLNPSPLNEKIMEINLDSVDYFILNEIEAKQLLQMDTDVEIAGEELTQLLLNQFPKAKIMLTLGGLGSVYKDHGNIIKQEIYPTKVVDTTAAGDTFTGYFIAGLIKGNKIKEILEVAAKASSIAVSKAGAAPSIPYYQEVVKQM